MNKLSLKWLAMVLAGSWLAACTSIPGDPVQLPPAPLPRPQAGSTIIYDDGDWERIIEASETEVATVNHRGRNRVRFRNPFLRSKVLATSKSEIRREISGNPDALFPLQEGKSVTFTEKTITTYHESSTTKTLVNYWRCEVLGSRMRTLQVGPMAGWIVECDRYGQNWRPRDRHIFFYAPGPQQVISYTNSSLNTARSSSWEIAAVVPPEPFLEHPGLQQVLERQRSGSMIEISVEDAKVLISPTATFRTANGAFCRRANIGLLTGRIDEPEYLLVACRNSEGHWEVPLKRGASSRS